MLTYRELTVMMILSTGTSDDRSVHQAYRRIIGRDLPLTVIHSLLDNLYYKGYATYEWIDGGPERGGHLQQLWSATDKFREGLAIAVSEEL